MISSEKIKWQEVKGWAETHSVRSLVSYPLSKTDCVELSKYAKENSLTILPVGSSYTFGDMILNKDNMILNTCRMNKILSWDNTSGIMIVEPGVKVADVLGISLIENWTLCSIPGGLEVTIAGAVSNNIHGKDSWKVGNFGDHVIKMKLLTSSGKTIDVERSQNKDLFKAVVGGMGLIGIILEITLQLKKIPSAYVKLSSISTKNISESLNKLRESLKENDFSIAWIDAFSKNSTLGRGYVTSAKWIKNEGKIDEKRLSKSLRMSKRIFDILPAKPIWYILRPFYNSTIFKILNKFIYHRNRWGDGNKGSGKVILFTEFNFMHNKIPNINHVQRPYGFIEVQFLFPIVNGLEAITECLSICQEYGYEPFLCAVKMHKADDYMISFSGDGYSFNVDIPLRNVKLQKAKLIANLLFQIAVKYNGKIYLAKDELLSQELFNKIYPNHKKFLKIKNEIDPYGLYSSDLYKRLFRSN